MKRAVAQVAAQVAALTVALMVAGCASFDGHTLIPGKSTAGDVEGLMGAPAAIVERADGQKLLYYARGPVGRSTFVVELGADGVVLSVEQRLTQANIGKLVSGTTTTKQVQELLGPPIRIVRMERQERDVWEYPYRHYAERRIAWIQFSYDGVVQEALDMLDWSAYPPSGGRRGR